MLEVKKIWMDGKLLDFKDAKVHVLTHALHYGSAVFEGIRFYKTKKNSAIFRLNEHLERLFFSAKSINMEIPFSKKQLSEAISKLIKANKISEGYIRPIAFYGFGKMGLNPTSVPVNTAIAVWPWGSYLGEQGVKARVSNIRRIHPKTLINEAKISGHYVNSILATLEAKKHGFDEAILLDNNDFVAEGPGENIFYVKKNHLFTSKLGNILPGITRNSVINFAKDLKLKVNEMNISLMDLMKADEVFFTGTAAEITPIIQINSKKINNGKIGEITNQIKDYYSKITHGEVSKYLKWLTFVV